MKALVFITFVAYAACFVNGSTAPPLLGSKQCTWGPSYWCSNLTAASGCHAVRHCIQTVWEHKQLPPDTDTVCQTCIKMVTEARDQLQSNETEEEIKEVFDGSCKLIPIKIVSKECCKLADDFIPELIDTLASEMNPQVVCSVAGLCNSEKVDKLIEQYEKESSDEAPDTCEGCHTVVGILQQRFEKMSKDQVLQSFLQVCGRLGSLSDACSNVVVTYFKEIYEHLQANFNTNDVCLLSGECAAQFHTHVEITPLSKVGFVRVGEKDDLPCELCEQLVTHLRDLLVANTTENEFQRVLDGLCKQTGQFKDECLSIVDEYYPTIYNFLVSELNGTVACSVIGICPPSNTDKTALPLAPLLPVSTVPKVLEITNGNVQLEPLHPVNIGNDGSAIQIMQRPENMQLPIERIFPPHAQESYNDQLCLFCEYFLHYVQQAITNPKTEEEIKGIVDKGCDRLPSSVHDTCVNFVDSYGDAVVALLAQEIDPSTVCPLIKLCPSSEASNVEVFFEQKGENPKCPLCLFAVTRLEEMVENEKTESKIRNSLNRLCSHFSGHVAEECQSFVNEYSDRLVEMLIADFNPQEVCVYLRLCEDKMPPKPVSAVPELEDVQILTNQITDYTSNGEFIVPIKGRPAKDKPECVICEFAMSKVQDILKNKTTEDEIKDAVMNICTHLPKSVRGECTSFVQQYADIIITLLIEAIEPQEICARLGLCDTKKFDRPPKVTVAESARDTAEVADATSVGSPQCVLCKMVMSQLEKVLIGNVTKREVETALYEICKKLPKSDRDACDKFVEKHGDTIVSLILQAVQPSEICSLLFLCSAEMQVLKDEISQCALCESAYMNYVDLVNGNQRITARAICKSMSAEYKQPCRDMLKKDLENMRIFQALGVETVSACYELNYCKGTIPLVRKRREEVPIGGDPCTWGPAHWCASLQNAQNCGALEHCKEKVWYGDSPSK